MEKKTTQWNYGEKNTKIMLHMSQNLNGNHFWIIQVSDESQYRHVRFPAWRDVYVQIHAHTHNIHIVNVYVIEKKDIYVESQWQVP